MTEKAMEKITTEEKIKDDNIIFVGQKPLMNYVLAVITQFNGNGSNGVILKARGRAISTAVDTAEVVRNKFLKDAKLKDIKISTDSVTNEEGRATNVSSIEICLTVDKKISK
jgi:DNA-binding protein